MTNNNLKIKKRLIMCEFWTPVRHYSWKRIRAIFIVPLFYRRRKCNSPFHDLRLVVLFEFVRASLAQSASLPEILTYCLLLLATNH